MPLEKGSHDLFLPAFSDCMSGLPVLGLSDLCCRAMKDLKWLSRSVHDISWRYLKSTMCVIVSLAIVSDAGVPGAEVQGVMGAESRMSAMLGNMWKTQHGLHSEPLHLILSGRQEQSKGDVARPRWHAFMESAPGASAAGSSKFRRLRAVGQLRMERTSVFLSISTSTTIIHSCSRNAVLLMRRILSKCCPFQIKLAKLHNPITAAHQIASHGVFSLADPIACPGALASLNLTLSSVSCNSASS